MGKSKENGQQQERGFLARLKQKASPQQPKAGALSPSQQQQRGSRLPAPLSARGAKPSTPRVGGGGDAAAAPAASANVSLCLPGRGGDSPTPRNFAKPLQSARGPGTQLQLAAPLPSARSRTPDGSLTARRVPKEQTPPMPASTYRDALITSRYANAGGSRLPAPPPSARQAPAAARRAATPEASPQQQTRVLTQQMARASSETEQARQQISRLESGVGAKQAELAAALDQLAALGARREALAEHVTELGRLAEQAKKAEAGRKAQLQDLDVLSRSLQAGLEGHRLQEAAAANKAAAARATLLGMMQTAARALKLPALAASLQQELAAPGSSSAAALAAPAAAPLAAAAARAAQPQAQQVCPLSPSDVGSQGFITPAASIHGDDGASSDDDDAYVSDGGSSSSSSASSSASGAGEVTARPDAPAGGPDQQQQPPQQRAGPALPSLRLSPLAAGEPSKAGSADPAAAAAAALGASPRGQVSGAARLRLQAIRGRLEAALAEQAVDLDAPLAA